MSRIKDQNKIEMKRLVINYNGSWNESEYGDGEQLFVPVDRDIEFTGLVDLIYNLTKIDENKYELLIKGVALTQRCAQKYDIRNDSDVRFMLANEKYDPEIFVEKIAKQVQHAEGEIQQVQRADEDEETRKRQEEETRKRQEEETRKRQEEETKIRLGKIYAAAVKGKLDREVKYIFKCNPSDGRAELSDLRENALHIATKAGNNDFVKELVSKNYMEQDDLKKKDGSENTPFFLAVILGNTVLVEFMLKENEDLVKSRDSLEMLPIQVAAMLGNENMARYLYPPTKYMFTKRNCEDPHCITTPDLVHLLVRLIENDLYDYAQFIVKEFPQLAVERDRDGKTALHALVKKPLTSHCTTNSNRGILKRFYYRILNTRMVQNKKTNPNALELFKIILDEVSKLDYYKSSDLIKNSKGLSFDAAKEGNYEFLLHLIKIHPELIFEFNDDGSSIFHVAVEYRQRNIFELLDEKKSIKNIIFAFQVGEEKNTILHLAAKLPLDNNRLNVVPGAALQMQQELLWFKEVRKLVPPAYAGQKNKEGKTADTLFIESHKKLMKEGQEWMKTTADSCMIVATLIATIVFAATFTIPGGVKDDTGTPNFLKKTNFMFFVISDTISLVFSTWSILAFLTIRIARNSVEDFYRSLASKLLVGLVTLFISIIGMMMVFCATLFIVFDEGTIWPAVLAAALASIPVFMFIYHQIPLICDVIPLLCFTFPELSNLKGEKLKKKPSS